MNLHEFSADIVRRLPDLVADKANAQDVIEGIYRQHISIDEPNPTCYAVPVNRQPCEGLALAL